MSEPLYFSGRVHSIVFSNEAQEFYILRLVLDNQGRDSMATLGFDMEHAMSSVVVRGNVPGMKVDTGTWIGFEGSWVTHEQYGKQIQISKAPVVKTWTPEVAVNLLSSNGVGPRICDTLKTKLGDKLIDTLNAGDEQTLAQLEGFNAIVATHVIEVWRGIRSYFKGIQFLNESGVPKGKIRKIWQHFGDEAEKVLSSNPWALVEIDGITFVQADEVARRLKLDLKNPERVKGAVLFVCKTARGGGHVFQTTGEVLRDVQAFIDDATQEQIARALAACHKEGKLIVDRNTRTGTTAIYEPWLHQMESQCAKLLADRVSNASLKDPDLIAEYIESLSTLGVNATAAYAADPTNMLAVAQGALEDWGSNSKVKLSSDQRQAAINGLTQPVSILTGLPGTGKTTTLLSVVRLLQNAEVKLLLIAPTGIAAKRMAAVTGMDASTIHRAFKAKGFKTEGDEREAGYSGVTGTRDAHSLGSDGSGEEWEYGEDGKYHPADMIIVDESSMVDQHLLYRILTCTRPDARLMIVGDPEQLPSVGPGNVLREMIGSGLFPTVNLREIYRQQDTSQIVVAAHSIFRGEVPETGSKSTDDFLLVPADSEDKILEIVTKLAQRLFEKKKTFQVISPRHAGTLGVTTLNTQLRDLLNPKAPGVQEMRLGSETIREGDRVMVVKNDYENEIFNGDVGKVTRLDRRDSAVEVKIHGPVPQYVQIKFKEAPDKLRLAYAITVHKSQGQEYDTIVMPLVRSFQHQLQRNLLYTAITRAKKKVILVGHADALAKAVFNSRVDARNTLFLDRLRSCFPNPMGGSGDL